MTTGPLVVSRLTRKVAGAVSLVGPCEQAARRRRAAADEASRNLEKRMFAIVIHDDLRSHSTAGECGQPPFVAVKLVRSHARASFQSLSTVSGETLSTSAVSSALRPPKNRNSITFALRGSTCVKTPA